LLLDIKEALAITTQVSNASILRRCRQAIGDDKSSCLLAVDSVVPAGNIPHPSKVMDIGMMVFTSGHERTEQEFRDLFEKSLHRLIEECMLYSTVSSGNHSFNRSCSSKM
jgi:hypothetical protein